MTNKRVWILALALLLSSAIAGFAEDGVLKLPPYKKVSLKNGMTLLLMEQHEIPIISFSFVVKTGSTADPKGREGLASVSAELLRKGTKTRSADQISADLDFIGGQLESIVMLDYTFGRAEFMKKDLSKGLDLLTDVMLKPAFPDDEVSKLIKQRLDGVRSEKDQARGVIGTYFNSYFFGDQLYGRPTGGDEKTLAAITRDDVVKFYDTYYTPSNTILAVAGDFDSAEMERTLAEKFDGWAAKNAPAVKLPEMAFVKGKRLLLVDKPDSTQTYYQIGNLGIARKNPDRVYIQVVNTLFGGRFTSMLNEALRVNSGLTYGASSYFSRNLEPGPFVISTFTSNGTTEKAIDMTLDVLKRLHERGISEAELKSAKAYIKGQFPPQIETTDQLATQIAQLEFYGLDEHEINDFYAKIDAMTIDDARRVIKQYFPLDDLVFVLIGKVSDIESVAKKYATKIDTKSINQTGF